MGMNTQARRSEGRIVGFTCHSDMTPSHLRSDLAAAFQLGG